MSSGAGDSERCWSRTPRSRNDESSDEDSSDEDSGSCTARLTRILTRDPRTVALQIFLFVVMDYTQARI